MAEQNINNLIQQLQRLQLQQEDIFRQQTQILQQLEQTQQMNIAATTTNIGTAPVATQTQRASHTQVGQQQQPQTPLPATNQREQGPLTPVAIPVPVPTLQVNDWVRIRNPVLRLRQPRFGRITSIGRVFITVVGPNGEKVLRIPSNLEFVRRE